MEFNSGFKGLKFSVWLRTNESLRRQAAGRHITQPGGVTATLCAWSLCVCKCVGYDSALPY